MAGKTSVSNHCAPGWADRRSTIKFLCLGSVALLAGVGFAAPAHALAQEGWRWCRKCQGMFYGAGHASRCPTGGTHDSTDSGHYFQRVEDEIPGVQQGGWRWCGRCQGFFYGPNVAQSVCPAGGPHIIGNSGSYAAVIGDDAVGQQGGWRWCNKCQGMFYAPGAPNVCPADHTPHSAAASGHYATLY